MAIKAKLDILDIVTDVNADKKPGDDEILEKGNEEESDEIQTRGLFLSKVNRWAHRPIFWLILLSGLLCSSIAGILFILYRGGNVSQASLQEKLPVPGKPFQTIERMTLFEGFVIDQKDEKGNTRIIFCDIAIEAEKPNTIDHDRADVRNVMYTVLKKAAVKEGLSPEGRNRIKNSLRSELNNLLGANHIENVYITSYELN